MPHVPSLRLRKAALLAALLTPASAFAQFLHTDAGPYDYNNTANWNGGTINNQLTSTLTADQLITFGANTTLTSSLVINNTGVFNHTLRGTGGDFTLTLGGNISLGSSTTNTNTVTLGSTGENQKLNINLGGVSRTISVGTNRTLNIVNTISGANSVTKTGLGTLRLTDTANSYTGSTSIGSSGQSSGVVEVTKLANGGQASSIGASNNGNSNLVFGGNSTGTLRYVGSGDSTDRRFLIGGVGAIFDASGTGALLWTNTSAPTYASTGNARTITFTGTNTDGNTMSASFANSGAGATSILKQGSGRWILAGNNTHTGDTTIDAGTLELGSSASGGDGSNMILNGGSFATGGFSETFGTLDVNANAVIDLGSGDSDLVFADSSAVVWADSISLSFVNFTEGVDSIRFGIDEEGLDVLTQLGKITINGSAVAIDELGYLSMVTVPEPSSYAAFAGAGALLLAFRRRSRDN